MTLRSISQSQQLTDEKLERNFVLSVNKKPKFEIDLRLEGVPQDEILKDAKWMTKVYKKLENLKIGSCVTSIRNDLKNKR